MPRTIRSGPLNDGWLDRPNPTAPLRIVTLAGHPVTEVFETDRGEPRRAIPVASQHEWDDAFSEFRPSFGGIFALRAAEQCRADGAPLPAWVQREIIDWEDAGFTPTRYALLVTSLHEPSLAEHRANPVRGEADAPRNGQRLNPEHWTEWAARIRAGADPAIETQVVLDGLPALTTAS